MTKPGTLSVYVKTVAVFPALFIVYKLLNLGLQSRFHEPDLRCAVALVIGQGCVIICVCFYLFAARAYTYLSRTIRDYISPSIRDRVFALALADERWSTNIPKRGLARRVLEESIANALTGLKDAARDRVARFAVQEGFVTEWTNAFYSRVSAERKRAVSLLGLVSGVAGETILRTAVYNKDAATRAEAYRGLLRQEDREHVAEVFRSLLRESFIVRALVANDLKRHARYLAKETIPSILKDGSPNEVARCFEFLIVWKTALPYFDLDPWTSDQSERDVWPLVLSLLPYVHTDERIEQFVRKGLESNDLSTQCAAAEAVGRLKLERLIPFLVAALTGPRQLAIAAANALAKVGDSGQRRLEQIVAGSNRTAAAFAMEALEHATVRAA